jgi:hypothetical protein
MTNKVGLEHVMMFMIWDILEQGFVQGSEFGSIFEFQAVRYTAAIFWIREASGEFVHHRSGEGN